MLIHKLGVGKYLMRIHEVVTKPKSPKSPAQARIHSLQQGVERSRQQLERERELQRQQRETERKRKQQQTQSAML